jgi:hypothetical protein
MNDLTPASPAAPAASEPPLLAGGAVLSTTLLMPAIEPKFPRFVGD